MDKYYVVDLVRTGIYGKTYYWKASKYGYTDKEADAGTFSKEEAMNLCSSDIMGNTAMTPARNKLL